MNRHSGILEPVTVKNLIYFQWLIISSWVLKSLVFFLLWVSSLLFKNSVMVSTWGEIFIIGASYFPCSDKNIWKKINPRTKGLLETHRMMNERASGNSQNDGRDMEAGTWGSWSHCIHGQEAEETSMLMPRRIQWWSSNWIQNHLGDRPEVCLERRFQRVWTQTWRIVLNVEGTISLTAS